LQRFRHLLAEIVSQVNFPTFLKDCVFDQPGPKAKRSKLQNFTHLIPPCSRCAFLLRGTACARIFCTGGAGFGHHSRDDRI
jgi:hypothetical protein